VSARPLPEGCRRSPAPRPRSSNGGERAAAEVEYVVDDRRSPAARAEPDGWSAGPLRPSAEADFSRPSANGSRSSARREAFLVGGEAHPGCDRSARRRGPCALGPFRSVRHVLVQAGNGIAEAVGGEDLGAMPPVPSPLPA
jgi:hypothetical protein